MRSSARRLPQILEVPRGIFPDSDRDADVEEKYNGQMPRSILDSPVEIIRQPAAIYGPFSSAMVHRWLFHNMKEKEDTLKPTFQRCYSSLLVVDISGYTRLSTRISAEELKTHTNQYFSKLMNCIAEYRGDIVKFCGDSVMVMWPCSQIRKHDLHTVVTRCAAECALALMVECGHYVSDHDGLRIELSIHCAIGCGQFNSFFVGHDDRWEHLVYSEEMKPIESCLNLAKQGQIVCTPKSRKLIRNYFEFNDDSRLTVIRPRITDQENTASNQESADFQELASTAPPTLSDALEDSLLSDNRLVHETNNDSSPPSTLSRSQSFMNNHASSSVSDDASNLPATIIYASSVKNAKFS